MNTSNPILSIIVPTANRSHCISRCLLSLENQSFRDFEIIVVDSSSDEKTHSIALSFQEKWGNLRYYRSPVRMICKQVSLGIKKARGAFVGFCDDDDFCSPQMFQVLVDNLTNYNADISCCARSFEVGENEADIIFQTIIQCGHGEMTPNSQSTYFSGRSYLSTVEDIRKYTPVSRNLAITKTQLLLPNLIYYENQADNYWEDLIFVCIRHSAAKSMVVTSEKLYYYVHTAGSVARSLIMEEYVNAALDKCKTTEAIFEAFAIRAGRFQFSSIVFEVLCFAFFHSLYNCSTLHSFKTSFSPKMRRAFVKSYFAQPKRFRKAARPIERIGVWAAALRLTSLVFLLRKPKRTGER